MIEGNKNPGLSGCHNATLDKIMSDMIEHMLQIAVDPVFPPPTNKSVKNHYLTLPCNIMKNNRFRLIFDQERDGIKLPEVPEMKATQEKYFREALYGAVGGY